MDAQVIINGIDVTSYLIRINRDKNYCNISQTFSLELSLDYPNNIDPYNTVVIYEEGVKVLNGFVSQITKNAPESTITVIGQDIFKKVDDYFVSEVADTGFDETVRHWIDYILDLTGLTATYTDGNGPFVVPEQPIGLDNASNIIVQLLQYAGWYAYVDPDDGIIIGKIAKKPILRTIIQNEDILDMNYSKSYNKTRNVVKVFGGFEEVFGEIEPVFAKSSKDLSFLPVDQTVALANPLIGSDNEARKIAKEVLYEFSKPEFVKEYNVIGDPLLVAGKYVEILSDIFVGKALISSINSTFDDSGYRMRLVLDDLCPRLSNAVKERTELYAGTLGSGVWQYDIYESAWGSISNGLTDLYINDLSVSDGLFITSTPSGVFTRIGERDWEYHALAPHPSGITLFSGGYQYPTVYSNSYSAEVNAVVNWSGSTDYSWFYTGSVISGGRNFDWNYVPLDYTESGTGRFTLGLDMEGNYDDKYIVAQKGTTFSGVRIAFLDPELSGWRLFTWDEFNNSYAQIETNGSQVLEVDIKGNKIVYSKTDDTTSKTELYVYDSDEQVTSQLTTVSLTSTTHRAPRISPDLTKVAFHQRVSGGRTEIFTVNIDGTNLTNISNLAGPFQDRNPDWSPDGTQIVFDTNLVSSGPDLYKMNADGSSRTLIIGAASSVANQQPDWSHDGQWIVYSRNPDAIGDFDIFKIKPDGTSNTKITNVSLADTFPRWSQDDSRIYFLRSSRIYTIGANASEAIVALTNDTTYDIHPSYAADYSKIVLEKYDTTTILAPNYSNLYTVNHDGTGLTNITNHTTAGRFYHQPRWGHTSGKIYANRSSVGIISINADGTGESTVLAGVAAGAYFDVSPDENFIVYGGVSGIHLYDRFNATDVLYISSANTVATPAWSPDSRYIAFFEFDAGANFWYIKVKDYGNGTITTLYSFNRATNNADLVGPLYWSWDSTTLAFAIQTLGSVGGPLATVNLNGVASSNINTSAQSTTEYAGGFSPDDNYFLFTRELTGPTRIDAARGVFLFPILSNDYTVDSYNVTIANGTTNRNILLTTYDNENIYLVHEDENFTEVNLDTYLPISIYGSGVWYSEDPISYSGKHLVSTARTFDMYGRNDNEDVDLFFTTNSGIFIHTVSGITARKNTIAATEIEGRIQGSGEIFFSIFDKVKKSVDDCETYTDISTNLPDDYLITVLRLER